MEKDPATGLNAAVASVLNAERVRAKMTFVVLAERSGISKRTLIRQLSTTERHIDLADMETLAAIFNMTPVEVVTAAEEYVSRQARRS